MGAKDVLGKEGEQAAVSYLEGCGFRILDRNWRCADGEIDIVAADRRTFVVCEVKTRVGNAVRHAARRRRAGEAQAAAQARGPVAGRARHPVRPDPHRRGGPAAGRRGRVHHRARPGGGLSGARPHLLGGARRGPRPPDRGRGRHRQRAARDDPGRPAGHRPARGAGPDPRGDRQQRRELARLEDHRRPLARDAAQARLRLRPGHRDRHPGRRRGGAGDRARPGRCSSPNSASTGGCARCPESCPRWSRPRPGVDTVVVAAQNAAEAALVPGVRVIGASSLTEVARLAARRPAAVAARRPEPPPGPVPALAMARKLDLAEVLGQAEARLAVEICAAGGHNLSLLGPPGAGKTMLAERLPTILPPLETAAAIEVTSIHSVAGRLAPGLRADDRPAVLRPAPHLVEGRDRRRRQRRHPPGRRASLAHRGILFLDEAPEFHRDVLDALRQPLESGQVVIARAGDAGRLPRPVHPRPRGEPVPVREDRRAGQERVLLLAGGPAPLPRPDLRAAARPGRRQGPPAAGHPPRHALRPQVRASRPPSSPQRVAAARERCAARLAGTPWRVNAEVPGTALRRAFPPGPRCAHLAGPGHGTRPGVRPGRGQDRPRRLVPGRPRRPRPAGTRPGQPRDRTMARGGSVNGRLTDEAYARAALTYLAEPRRPPARAADPGARRGRDARRDQVGPPARHDRTWPAGTRHGPAMQGRHGAMAGTAARAADAGGGARLRRVGDQAHRARATRNGPGSWPTSGTTSPTRCGCAATPTCGSAAFARSRSSARGPRPPMAPTWRPSSPRPSPRAAWRWSPAAPSASTPRRTGARSPPTGSPSRCSPAAWTCPTRPRTRNCSTRSPPRACS